ncbi:hypothetical protein [Bacillus sp. AFS088145]|uniref:hypothetical protein n=1 Tax=Bacillus sp. AFS088145 TaxID=2033514 RepID=UPI000BF58552|nr:hypothetical protein [Bacillus sp. AFS088145]PFH90641.1 hypothetical protein COI44_03905 [Bacillus sp. AFS088145]
MSNIISYLTFIVIVFLLIFFLKPGSKSEISGSSKCVHIVEKQNYSEGFGGGDNITTVSGTSKRWLKIVQHSKVLFHRKMGQDFIL